MPPAYELLLLNTAIPQIQAAQSGDTYVVPRDIAFSAALTLSAGTANGVPYLDGSKVLTTGSALTFDGSTFQADTTGFRIGKSPTDSPSANIYASVIAAADQTSELWLGANTVAAVGGSFLSGLGFYNTDNTTPGANLSGIKAYIKDSSGSMSLNFYAGNTYYAANTPQYTIDPAYHAWSSGTTEGMRLTSTGLGIGTTSPATSARLHVYATGDYTDEAAPFTLGNSATGGVRLYAGVNNTNDYSYIGSVKSGTRYNNLVLQPNGGNLGLGVTPSAWGSGWTALQVGSRTVVHSAPDGRASFGGNYYVDGTNARYIASAEATQLMQVSGQFRFYTAPSGTAGDPISFTQAMTLDASGNLGIGQTNPSSKLEVTGVVLSKAAGNAGRFDAQDTDSGGAIITINSALSSAGTPALQTQTNHPILFAPNNTERARITSGGDFQVSSGGSVQVGGTAARATTAGTNRLDIFNGTAPVGTLTNGISIYSSSGEAYVMDAAGNATLFSPHDAVTNEWIFRSKHTPTGKVLKIDVERLLKFVNDHFGLDAVHEFVEE